MESSHRRSLQHLPRSDPDQSHPRERALSQIHPHLESDRMSNSSQKPSTGEKGEEVSCGSHRGREGKSSSPVRMEPDVNPQDEKQHRKSTPRRASQAPREDFDGPPPLSFKPLCPAKPSPSFLELPSTQWRPSPGLPYTQTARIGKGKRHFSPEHQPQECFGLLECMHNNIQTQTQIAQAQLSLLEDMRESMNILLARQEKQNQERLGQTDQNTSKGSASSPSPTS